MLRQVQRHDIYLVDLDPAQEPEIQKCGHA